MVTHLYEPSADEILLALLPRYIGSQIFQRIT